MLAGLARALALLALVPSLALAAEPYEYSELVTQRNNALNDLVNSRSAWHRDSDYWRDYVAGDNQKWADTEEYWKKYVAGVVEQHKQAARESGAMAARAAEVMRGHGR